MSTAMSRRSALRVVAGVSLASAGFGPSARAAPAPALQVSRPKLEALPTVTVQTMQGESRKLDQELGTDKLLVLNFVFTTCSTSCSVQTAMLAEVQRELAARKREARFASITIDPDNDTPQQLRSFAQKHGVSAGWQFYTGRFDDLLRVQKHFDVFRGSKAAHAPVLLLRRHARAPWVRAEGFPGVREVLRLIDSLPESA